LNLINKLIKITIKFFKNLKFSVSYILLILVTSFWTFWGTVEMFHEGFYKPFEWIYFLLPSVSSLSLSIISILFPIIGGYSLVL
jgi:hypothetical protein